MRKAVVLLSGGLDSTTCLAVAKAAGYQCFALSFSYGQRHNSEIEAAKRVATWFEVAEHRIVNLDINQFGGSALTDETINVPDYQPTEGIPLTYVPARNTIFLAIALGYAEVIGANDLFIGISSVDYSNYPDCRPEYMEAFKKMAGLATRAGVEGNPLEIHTPLIKLSKAETVRLGAALGVDYALTVSCYQADEKGRACGRCDSCTFRQKGFVEAGIADPTLYKHN
ncbi:ExsB protein [Legionella quinlivanii]|uniref:7-cyano-7-deazaguanine synthase n=1 Tax=Legionella quinlivanii TaxID=45073 RepID=A0A0W0Y5W8_9GAMM|nr:7-cyano-7-deazaguanine synthase QueC [Legionella quinlivanii]KTD52054.1 ExsB protein [Legionella quinlivanii]MCW8452318.1 7-cyano-7-deazaguanine synthase QueC [Legionella quinlivanii]SEF88771.1 preQ(0) biosynthesis protein QueC [Legionella quinlivanii DSM 21216]STY12450.1 ExsB protein [Legionella quinlivanii]